MKWHNIKPTCWYVGTCNGQVEANYKERVQETEGGLGSTRHYDQRDDMSG